MHTVQPLSRKATLISVPSGVLGEASLEGASSGNGVKWMALVGALSSRVVNSQELGRGGWGSHSGTFLVWTFVYTSPMISIFFLSTILSGELSQLSQVKFKVRTILSWLPLLAPPPSPPGLCFVVRIIDKLVWSRLLSHTHPSGLFADTEPKTGHLSGTCPDVQVLGWSWFKPRSSPLLPAHSPTPSALFCLPIVDPWAVHDMALCSSCMSVGRS